MQPVLDKFFRRDCEIMDALPQIRCPCKENPATHWFIGYGKQFRIYPVRHDRGLFAWESKVANQIIAHPFRGADCKIRVRAWPIRGFEPAADGGVVRYVLFPAGELLSLLHEDALSAEREINL